jgi:Asp-tRNA(Asn)/Glu-tRNA(Gln) amidotransferase A subunit family amidase
MDEVMEQPQVADSVEVEVPESEPINDSQEEGAAPEDSDSAPVEDDSEEIEYDGEKYKVPKNLKDAFLRQQDYTQKTQSVAEQRKAIESQRAELAQQAEMQRQFIAEYAEVHAIDRQLQQFSQVNWQQLIDTDPVQAMKLDREMRALQERRQYVASSVTQKQQQAHMQAQQETAKRLQEGKAVLEREIKGWSPEVANSLVQYGQEFGYSAEELKSVQDPRAVKLLHKAWQFDQLMKKQAAQKERPPVQEKPVTRITAQKGSATKDPSKMMQFCSM